MPRPPAHRRRLRPTMAAAVGLGVLGGSLVGIGALGFDKVPVEAASCSGAETLHTSAPGTTPSPEPSPASTPSTSSPTATSSMESGESAESGESGESTRSSDSDAMAAAVPVGVQSAAEPADGGSAEDDPGALGPGTTTAPASDERSAALGADTTTSPAVGARKPVCGSALPTEVINLPGGSEAPGNETTGESDDTSAEPTRSPAPVPAPIVGAASLPTPVPTSRPVVTPQVREPAPASLPVVPAPSTTRRGYSVSFRPSTSTPGRTGTITRPEVIARAVSWVTQQVPYSQVRWWTDRNGSFRQDCSGYVSMVWRTDQRTNYWTGNLGSIADRIPSSTMQPGDILLLPGRHTVIFLGWANQTRTKFHLFEEYRTGYPARLVRNASLAYYLDRGYGAYRYDGIRDAVPGVNPPVATPVPAPAPTATPAATSITPPASAAGPSSTAGPTTREDTVALLSAESAADGNVQPATMRWTIQQAVAGLPAVDWTPVVAADFTPENDALDLVAPDADASEVALASTPVDSLIAAQSAIDQAEQRRLAATTNRAFSATANNTSGGVYVLAAGLGLLFVAVPLGATSRRAWKAASPAVPVPPGGGIR